MTAIDILGWVATGAVVVSFTVKDMWKLRAVNSLGTFLWLIYGGLKQDYPLLVVNILILLAHADWFRKQRGGVADNYNGVARDHDPTYISYKSKR